MANDEGEKRRLQNYLNSVMHNAVNVMDGVNNQQQKVVVLDIRQNSGNSFGAGHIIALSEDAAERLRQLLNERKENEKP